MSNNISIDQLASRVASDIQSAVEGEVKAYCENILKKHIMKSVYAGRVSAYYDRTYQFVNAVEVMNVKRSSKTVSFSIRINASKMGVFSSLSGGRTNLPSHGGVSGQDAREGLAEILNDGITSKIVPRRNAAKFFESATDELDDDLAGILVRGLRARGWDATVV